MKKVVALCALVTLAASGVSAYVGYRCGLHEQERISAGETMPLNTQFVWAAKAHALDRMEALLAKGADINAPQAPGSFTALDVAADRGYAKVVQWLLDHGADPARSFHHGTAALDAARHRVAQSNAVIEALETRVGN